MNPIKRSIDKFQTTAENLKSRFPDSKKEYEAKVALNMMKQINTVFHFDDELSEKVEEYEELIEDEAYETESGYVEMEGLLTEIQTHITTKGQVSRKHRKASDRLADKLGVVRGKLLSRLKGEDVDQEEVLEDLEQGRYLEDGDEDGER